MTELAMATATATAIPKSSPLKKSQDQRPNEADIAQKIPRPKLRLHVQELRHPASSAFLALIPDVASTLDTALGNIPISTPVHTIANQAGSCFSTLLFPPTRSVTLFLRDFEGVAYTTGSDLDDDHKEIHLSLSYVQHCTDASAKADPLHELVGVLTHELVHCYQHTAPPKPSAEENETVPRPPGGLIEGIADFVRLKARLEPPHWKRPQSAAERPSQWDAGYQNTAYFLAWLEDVRVGLGAIGMLNDRLLRVGYVGESEDERVQGHSGFWNGLFGVEVAELWDEYGHYLDSL
ncbi:hypothetical protein N7495_002529 [Penicillium taxi]|uniref:uncharacterized protein n=1 Tax=Penicillium taxi TaxID=168475 RepID=UPI002545A613|nr:uncharacterized protein N7495_002529 [Penicillium taxi]KAJ5902001.1 hypothetical protein N7495_002529 [Penicillium taxi]